MAAIKGTTVGQVAEHFGLPLDARSLAHLKGHLSGPCWCELCAYARSIGAPDTRDPADIQYVRDMLSISRRRADEQPELPIDGGNWV